MITPQQIENAEKEAWQNMFDIAPANFRNKTNLYYKHTGGGICQVFPHYPVVHFNMVMGLGFSEPVTKTVLENVEAIYAEAAQPVYMIQFCDSVQQASPTNIFELMNYQPGGIWERVVWHPQPVSPAANHRNIRVEMVTDATAEAWQKFILDYYHYPADGWLPAFVTTRWYNFMAIENNNIIGCRSVFVSNENIAWSGVEAPVPLIMTNDLEPDFVLWKHIQEFCLQKNVQLIAADIETPSPARDSALYKSFSALGFKVAYPRKLYRKKKAGNL